MDKRIIAISLVAILVVAGVGIYFAMDHEPSEEKKGLYRLDAKVSEVNMGQCSATPGVILTFESMYKDYYGDIVNDSLTLENAQADKEFWDKYGKWTPMIKDNGNGTYDVYINTKAHGDETVTIPVSNKMVTMGTMYSETLYFLACQKYGVEPYSEKGLNNKDVGDMLSSIITGGMSYQYYVDNDVSYMTSYIKKANYFDLGTNSVQSMDAEKLTAALKDAKSGEHDVIYMASGSRISSADHYTNNTQPCIKTGTEYAFFAPAEISEVYASIECIGLLYGFDQKTIDDLIENIQLRLYKIYDSVEEKTAGKEAQKVYWESGSGEAVKSAMAKIIVKFLGFDDSMMDGAEHDLESILKDDPSYIVFYTNDKRSDADRMRANN